MNYLRYKFSKKELLGNFMIAAGFIMVIAKLFYGTYYAAVVISPFIIVFIIVRKKRLNEKRKTIFKIQFKDAILSIADLMRVGYSVENSIRECYREMLLVYGADSYICRELSDMIKKIEINMPIERIFEELASRTDIHDIILFSQIFSVAKRMGGNMIIVIGMVSDNISQSLSVEDEINVVISEKKLEQKIMSFIPIIIIVYLSVSSSGFLNIMYETIMGKIIMTICLAAYGVAAYLAERIMRIET